MVGCRHILHGLPAALLATAFVAAQGAGASFFFACRPGYYALTFDDGPGKDTPRLLDILKASNVKTTFFVVGTSIKGRESILKRAFDEGHQIASHTFDHKSLNTLTAKEIEYEVVQNQAVIKSAIGQVPNYIRPPFGECNTTCGQKLASYGLAVVQWNVDSNDWRLEGQPSKYSELFDNLFKDELEGGVVTNRSDHGWISLQHDTLSYTIDYVEPAIKKIRSMGFTITTIEQCLLNPPLPMYEGGTFSNATTSTMTTTTPGGTNFPVSSSTVTAEPSLSVNGPPNNSGSPPNSASNGAMLAFLWASVAAAVLLH